METYNPILEAKTLEKGSMGSPRPRPSGGIAHVLYGRRGEPLVLTRGGRLSLGESLFGGYTESFVVDLSAQRLERTMELPCRGDVLRFTAAFMLTCWVVDPKAVVRHNIRDAGAVLWSAVDEHARAVSRRYSSLGDTTEAEQAIAERLADIVLHPAFHTESVEVRLSPDQQAVEIGRRGTNTEVWNSLVGNPLAAAHLAEHPDDIEGALRIMRDMQRHYDETVVAYEAVGGSMSEVRGQRKQMLENQARRLGLRSQGELASEGVIPVLEPRPDQNDGDEDDDDD